MNLIERLSLSSEVITRDKPNNYKIVMKICLKMNLLKLPNIFPIVSKKSFIPPCGRLFNGFLFNPFNLTLKFQ